MPAPAALLAVEDRPAEPADLDVPRLAPPALLPRVGAAAALRVALDALADAMPRPGLAPPIDLVVPRLEFPASRPGLGALRLGLVIVRLAPPMFRLGLVVLRFVLAPGLELAPLRLRLGSLRVAFGAPRLAFAVPRAPLGSADLAAPPIVRFDAGAALR